MKSTAIKPLDCLYLPSALLTSLSWLTAVSCLLAAQPLYAQATFTGLGLFGATQSRAHDVSADGMVVVGTTVSSPGSTISVFRWTPQGSMLHAASERDAAVSADGSTVVGTYLSPSGPEAFRWLADGSFRGLGDLAGGPFESKGFDITSDGHIIVGVSQATSGSGAFQWTEASGMVELALNAIEAHGISADGAVIVGAEQQSPFRWTAQTGISVLPPIPRPNYAGGRATAVSADGSTVVGLNNFRTSLSGVTVEAFRWTEQTGTISLQPSPWNYSIARDVSANGSIVVGEGTFLIPGGTDIAAAFYWSDATSTVSLQDLLLSLGATNLDGWQLTAAEGISDDGRIIVGTGIHHGVNEGWVATIPEPTAVVLAVLALAGLLGCYFRKARNVSSCTAVANNDASVLPSRPSRPCL